MRGGRRGSSEVRIVVRRYRLSRGRRRYSEALEELATTDFPTLTETTGCRWKEVGRRWWLAVTSVESFPENEADV